MTTGQSSRFSAFFEDGFFVTLILLISFLLSIDELVNFLSLKYAHVLSLRIHLRDPRVQRFVQQTSSVWRLNIWLDLQRQTSASICNNMAHALWLVGWLCHK